MPSENSDQSGSSDQMIQKNHSYIISVSPEKSDLHLFFYFLKQTFKRSEDILKCYLKYNKIPPVFPLPLFILLLIFIIGYFNILLGFLTLIISPHFFYLWWSIKFFRKLKLYYLLFSYMQFSLELATILGMLRGFIRLKLEK